MTDTQKTKYQICDELSDIVDPESNKYFIMNVMSRRARALTEGSRPVIPFDKYDPVKIAGKEFREGKLQIGVKKKEEDEEDI